MITDEGFLNNPYRSYRFVNPSDDRLFALAHRDLSAHAHQQRGRRQRALLPALSRRGARRLSLLHGHLGHRRQHVRAGLHASAGRRGPSKSATATTRRATPTSTATCSTAANQQNFLARDKELSTFNSQTLQRRRDLRIRAAAAGASSRRARSTSVYDRIEFDYDDFRDARFSLLPASDPNFRAGRHRAAVHLRRERHPGVRVGLVLRRRQPSRSAALLISAAAAAEPFPARDHNPLLAGFGLPVRTARSRSSGESWTIAADLNWASTSLVQRAGAEQLIVDAETREARVTIAALLVERLRCATGDPVSLHRRRRARRRDRQLARHVRPA